MKSSSIYYRLTYGLQAILLIATLGALIEQQWLNALISFAIMGVTLVPLFLKQTLNVYIPPQFQLLAITFVFASLFMGEVHGYYTKFWWWDVALHTSSGFLLGIVGFLLVHLLNESKSMQVHLQPGFVAFFAFLFALGFGTLWEVFEFIMDRSFGTTMQKPAFNDPSGLTDTMIDLMVDALGGLIISIFGYRALGTIEEESFLERWISSFKKNNPRLFEPPQ